MDKYTTKENILHQGYVAEIEHLEKINLKEFIKQREKITFACLDEVTDPRNIGSVIRSAASFNIDGIIIKERHFPSESKMMYKAASGCMEHINIFEVSNINTTLKFLRDNNFWVYAMDSNSATNINKIDWTNKKILLFGSEGSGIKKHTTKYSDFFVKIKINSKVDSLNISNSASIIFYHLENLK